MAVTRYEIQNFGDVVEAGAAIRAGQPAEVSIAAVLPGVARRVIDFFSGVAVAGSATMSRLSPGLFLITPPAPVSEAEPLVSLPRSRRTELDVPALAKLGGAQSNRPFWPDKRLGSPRPAR
jgi:FtsZ-interacting cell division protein YlmF